MDPFYAADTPEFFHAAPRFRSPSPANAMPCHKIRDTLTTRRKPSPGERVQSAWIADHIWIVRELRPSPAIAGLTPEAGGVYLSFTKGRAECRA
jgi:hypothetical protein